MTSLNLPTSTPSSLPTPPASNGVTYKWILGFVLTVVIAAGTLLYSSTEPQSVSALRERVAALEQGFQARQRQLDRIEGELTSLHGSVEKVDDKLDEKFSEVLRRLDRERRR